MNIAELIFAPSGFKPFIKNWEDVAITTIRRLQQEQQEYPDRHIQILDNLKKTLMLQNSRFLSITKNKQNHLFTLILLWDSHRHYRFGNTD